MTLVSDEVINRVEFDFTDRRVPAVRFMFDPTEYVLTRFVMDRSVADGKFKSSMFARRCSSKGRLGSDEFSVDRDYSLKLFVSAMVCFEHFKDEPSARGFIRSFFDEKHSSILLAEFTKKFAPSPEFLRIVDDERMGGAPRTSPVIDYCDSRTWKAD